MLQKQLLNQMAKRLIDGSIKDGQAVDVDVMDGELNVSPGQ